MCVRGVCGGGWLVGGGRLLLLLLLISTTTTTTTTTHRNYAGQTSVLEARVSKDDKWILRQPEVVGHCETTANNE